MLSYKTQYLFGFQLLNDDQEDSLITRLQRQESLSDNIAKPQLRAGGLDGTSFFHPGTPSFLMHFTCMTQLIITGKCENE